MLYLDLHSFSQSTPVARFSPCLLSLHPPSTNPSKPLSRHLAYPPDLAVLLTLSQAALFQSLLFPVLLFPATLLFTSPCMLFQARYFLPTSC